MSNARKNHYVQLCTIDYVQYIPRVLNLDIRGNF